MSSIQKLQELVPTPTSYFDVQLPEITLDDVVVTAPLSQQVQNVTFDPFVYNIDAFKFMNKVTHIWDGQQPQTMSITFIETVKKRKALVLNWLLAWGLCMETGIPRLYKKNITIVKIHSTLLPQLMEDLAFMKNNPVQAAWRLKDHFKDKKTDKWSITEPFKGLSNPFKGFNAQKIWEKNKQGAGKTLLKIADRVAKSGGKIGGKQIVNALRTVIGDADRTLFTYEAIGVSLASFPSVSFDRNNDKPLKFTAQFNIDDNAFWNGLEKKDNQKIKGFSDSEKKSSTSSAGLLEKFQKLKLFP